MNDDEQLAAVLDEALAVPPASGAELGRIRGRLADSEFGHRRYAERFYDLLVELARQGRRERQEPLPLAA
jgi:hypothetical protein